MNRLDLDRRIAIIGGGPAGAQCALRLAGAGFEVTLFEPRSHHEKACGGGIPARGFAVYPYLDDPALPAKKVERCLLIAPSGRRAAIPLAEPLVVVGRADLHHFMLRRAVAAGARLLQERVIGFARHPGNPAGEPGREAVWRLRTRDAGAPRERGPYDFLVAADGAAGASRRRLIGGPHAAVDLSQGIGYYLPGISEDAITLRFYRDLHGYLWVFPRPDHSSVGICATLGSLPAAELKRRLDAFIVETYGPDPLRSARRYAALIPGAPDDPGSNVVSGEGWALVGDSGRFVDPLTREGIFHAMQAADRLADALIAGRPADYAAAWSNGTGREFAWAARHADGFFDAGFIERVVLLCAVSPRIARVMSDLLAGRQPYRSLKRRLVLNAPIVAWQVARRILSRGGRDGRVTGRPPFPLSRDN